VGKRIVILGASFAGLTVALGLADRLVGDHEIVVVSRSDDFVFLPSLIWVPFGLRERADISFPLAPALERRGITFRRSPVVSIALHDKRVVTADGPEPYDVLVVATGARADWAAVPGLGPRGGFTHSIFRPSDADLARNAYEALLQRPGPVVVGAAPGASSFSAAYEFALNLAHQLQKRGLAGAAPITFVTPEPFLAHLGLGGFGGATRFTEAIFARLGVDVITGAALREVTADALHLADGRRVPFSFAMIAPALRGADVVAGCGEIVDRAGFVKVDDTYRTAPHPEVFAAGAAVAIEPAHATAVPCAVPKTGYLAEEMARVVAYNIASLLDGGPMLSLPPSAIRTRAVLDAGDTGVIMSADKYLEPGDNAWILPGPEAHWAKVAFEKWFLAKRSRGRV
jgi:sulfide:quinone oxidoreductase